MLSAASQWCSSLAICASLVPLRPALPGRVPLPPLPQAPISSSSSSNDPTSILPPSYAGSGCGGATVASDGSVVPLAGVLIKGRGCAV